MTCAGLLAKPGTSAEIAQEAAAAQAAAAAESRRRTRLIIGLVVGLGLPITLGAALSVWLYRRKPVADKGKWDFTDAEPRPYTDTSSSEGVREVPHSTASSPKTSPKSATFATAGINSPPLDYYAAPAVPFDRQIEAQRQGDTSPTAAGTAGVTSPTFTRNSSILDVYRKAREAALERQSSTQGPAVSRSLTTRTTASSRGLPSTPRPMRSNSHLVGQTFGAPSLDPDAQPDIIIQHKDGGVVQELPPPYAYRSGADGPSSASSSRQP